MKRILAKFGIDFFIFVMATPLAYFMRVEGVEQHTETIIWLTLAMIPLKTGIILYEKFFLQSWHRVGLRDLFTINRGVLVYSVVFLGAAFLFRTDAMLIP